MIEKTLADTILNFSDGVAELFCDSLSFECFDRIRMCRGRHDDECDDSDG